MFASVWAPIRSLSLISLAITSNRRRYSCGASGGACHASWMRVIDCWMAAELVGAAAAVWRAGAALRPTGGMLVPGRVDGRFEADTGRACCRDAGVRGM